MEHDVRVGDLIQRGPDGRTKTVLVLFKTDEGVRRNGGRVGAAQGPERILEALYKMTPDARNGADHCAVLETTAIGETVSGTSDLEGDQERLGAIVGAHFAAGRRVIVLGGGHETLFGHFLGYVQAGLDVQLRNIDAHTDVRPLKDNLLGHSGSPFRQALEHASGRAKGYRVAGLERFCVSEAHAKFAERHGGIIWRETLQHMDRTARGALWNAFFSGGSAPVLASFDMDALSGSVAPGVSAVNPAGLSTELWLEAAFAAGRNASVRSFEVVEFNPLYDRDGITAKLGALTVWMVMSGMAE